MMKNKVLHALFALLAAVFVCSCDPAEVERTYEGYFRNVFDVKKSFVYPAFSDTFYIASNMKEFSSKLNGKDRAYMTMYYFYDAYAMSKPEVEIADVITTITPQNMSSREDVRKHFGKDKYNSPFNAVEPVVFYDLTGNVCDEPYTYIWADSATQNIGVRYNKGLNCEAKLVVDSLRGNTLFFRLYAHLQNRGWDEEEVFQYTESPDVNCRILSYKMDWDAIYNDLTPAEQAEIVTKDSLTSNIALVVKNCKIDANGLYIPNKGFTGDLFKNKLYKK